MPYRRTQASQRHRGRWILSLFVLVLSLPVAPGIVFAAPDIEILLHSISFKEEHGDLVELRILNPGDVTNSITLPDRVEARIDNGTGKQTIILTRTVDTPASISVAAHGFAAANYHLPVSGAWQNAVLSIPAWSSQTVPLPRPTPVRLAEEADMGADIAEGRSAVSPTDRTAGNLFIDNLSIYEPIYAVYGPGTNTQARIQISFKYKLFGSQNPGVGPPQGLHFAYTQRMFWDLAAQSSPFRNVDYQPELIYVTRPVAVDRGITLAAQAGVRHESNGREGPQSRSVNSLYVAPMAAIPLGGNYRLSVAPRFSIYVGDKSENPDIVRYRGHVGLLLGIGKDYGLRLSTSTRFNPGSGKGAFNADLSYPLPLLLGGGPDVYIFTQSFIGYGENLLDYDRHTTRLRFGLALVR